MKPRRPAQKSKSDSARPRQKVSGAKTLRQRAEAALKPALPEDLDTLSPAEAARLLYELRVHQIELEMQNEELRRAQQELEASRARYFDLYDLAPVGYLTISGANLILEANLMAATLLGRSKSELARQPLTRFIHPGHQDSFYFFRRQTPAPGKPHILDLRLSRPGSEIWVQLALMRGPDAPAGKEVHRVTLTDITALNQAKEALRKNQALLRSFYDSAPFMMGVVELQGNQIIGVEANSGVAAFFGTTPEELAGCDGREMNQDDSITRLWLEKYRRSQRERQAVRFEYQHPTKAGLVWLSASVAPLLDSSTPRPMFSFVAEDVTERKRSEEALRQLNVTLESQVAERTARLRVSELLLQQQFAELDQIYRTAPVGLCQLDRELRYVRINDRLAALNGRPAAEHIGRTLAEIVPALAPHITDNLRHVLNTGQAVLDAELGGSVLGPAAMGRDWLASYYPLKAGDGEVLGVSVVLAEVTELKQTAAALERARDTLAEAQRIARLGSWEYIVATRQTNWSEEQYRIYGLDPSQPSPSHDELLAKFTLPEDVAPVNSTFTKAVQSRSVFELEHRIVRSDGAVRWTYDRAQPYFDAQGELVRYVGTTMDITTRKQAEDLIQSFSREILAAREQERKQVAAALHHDLGSLAVGMFSYLDVIGSQIRSGKSKEAIASLARTEELLDKAVGNLKQVAVSIRPPELDTIGLRGALRQHFSQITENGRIQVRFRESLGRKQVTGDAAAVLFRIAQEAVTNAITHGRAEKAEVSLRVSKGEIILTVTDDGCGFDTAKQTENVTSHMGLRVMNEMALLAGGNCTVVSEQGRGTTVMARLPVPGNGRRKAAGAGERLKAEG